VPGATGFTHTLHPALTRPRIATRQADHAAAHWLEADQAQDVAA
jgi:hypothetical protein